MSLLLVILILKLFLN